MNEVSGNEVKAGDVNAQQAPAGVGSAASPEIKTVDTTALKENVLAAMRTCARDELTKDTTTGSASMSRVDP